MAEQAKPIIMCKVFTTGKIDTIFASSYTQFTYKDMNGVTQDRHSSEYVVFESSSDGQLAVYFLIKTLENNLNKSIPEQQKSLWTKILPSTNSIITQPVAFMMLLDNLTIDKKAYLNQLKSDLPNSKVSELLGKIEAIDRLKNELREVD